MKKILQWVFSMSFTVILIAVFGIAIAVATFIENDFGTIASKDLIYNARWFEVLLGILAINLIGSIIRYKMYNRTKWTILAFHVSFLVILLGAAITRFISYEGTMHIRENDQSAHIISQNMYISAKGVGENEATLDKSVLFSALTKARFQKTYTNNNGEKFIIKLNEFVPNAARTLIPDSNGDAYLILMVSHTEGSQNYFIKSGTYEDITGLSMGFNSPKSGMGFIIEDTDSGHYATADMEVVKMNMATGLTDTIAVGNPFLFQKMALYAFAGRQLVVKEHMPSARVDFVKGDKKENGTGMDALRFSITHNNVTKHETLLGQRGVEGESTLVEFDESAIELTYGAKRIDLPFSLKLIDFQLDRYPGSASPSSYASEVILIDKDKSLEEPYRIYMNNVLNYGGYRFFQSSYDMDEEGTILSVNHDYWGTLFTYIGYLLLTIGLALNFFSNRSRFRKAIVANIKNKTAIIIFALAGIMTFGSVDLNAQNNAEIGVIPEAHAKLFGELVVLDQGGRLKPINTLSSEIVRKIAHKNSLLDLNPDQVLLEMTLFPEKWQDQKIIRVSNPEVRKIIGIQDKFAGFSDFFDKNSRSSYLLGPFVDEAYRKKPSQRDEFDKQIIKVDERLNIVYGALAGTYMDVFPVGEGKEQKWIHQEDAPKDSLKKMENLFIRSFFTLYKETVIEAVETGEWATADSTLTHLHSFQKKVGEDTYPSVSKRNAEIFYNNSGIFKRLMSIYGLLGLLLLIFGLIEILNTKVKFKTINSILVIVSIAAFLLHTFGLILRWYVSGHAPWSNGYETMIYIGWATVLAGLFFGKKAPTALGIVLLLASIILMVANLTWMDPEITNLVPVLKSYWLVIHVAVITASYAFLGIACFIGLFNLLLFIFKNSKNAERLDSIILRFSRINEINILIGLAMLSIGTFLGGVWANESWGRYWGWDPKETWALITILVYAFIIHLRYIPATKGKLVFNIFSMWGYASVMMTFFGVNFYLSGLHSYAKGDPVPIPNFVYYTVGILLVVTVMAIINHLILSKKSLKQSQE